MTNLTSPQATDSLETWLSYLENSHFKAIDMGLERIQVQYEALQIGKPAPFVVTVAGTNGKGSTCRLLEALLLKAGKRVGVYSSPHLLRYNERVRINGELLTDEAHTQAFAFISEKRTASLTYFEYSTLSALYLFAQADLDVVILEVGLGGRLDATNIVDPDIAVITSIDLDHIEFLGDNREAIGREKAGIFRQGIPVVIGEPDCPQSVSAIAAQLDCRLLRCGKEWRAENDETFYQWQWQDKTLRCALPNLPIPNIGTALTAFHLLPYPLSEADMREVVEQTQMFGRFYALSAQDWQNSAQKAPLAKVIIDVGHNPHAARYLAARLNAKKQPQQRIFAVFSALKDKDLGGIVQPLDGLIDHWYCAGLNGVRGQTAQSIAGQLQAQLPLADCRCFDNVANAAEAAFQCAGQNDIILVFGSFYTVGDFWQWLHPNA